MLPRLPHVTQTQTLAPSRTQARRQAMALELLQQVVTHPPMRMRRLTTTSCALCGNIGTARVLPPCVPCALSLCLCLCLCLRL